MILVALGGNLPHPVYGAPERTCDAAVAAMAKKGLKIVRRSSWFVSSPVPPSDQPWYVNGVVRVEAAEFDASSLLALLHNIERDLGRIRGKVNSARIIDLDLLAWHDQISETSPILPHPRLHERAFVLYPLQEIAPEWRHPANGNDVATMIQMLPQDQQIHPISQGLGPS